MHISLALKENQYTQEILEINASIMDLANLDKMKVVDLRNELQSRGLDTKGVKAVLVERLRAHLEGGKKET